MKKKMDKMIEKTERTKYKKRFPMKLRFTWNGYGHLQKRIEDAGKKYYQEAEKIQGDDRAARLFTATNYRNGSKVEPALSDFVVAATALNKLKHECVFKHNLDISLVALATLPNEKKFGNERNLRHQNLLNSMDAAKKQGILYR